MRRRQTNVPIWWKFRLRIDRLRWRMGQRHLAFDRALDTLTRRLGRRITRLREGWFDLRNGLRERFTVESWTAARQKLGHFVEKVFWGQYFRYLVAGVAATMLLAAGTWGAVWAYARYELQLSDRLKASAAQSLAQGDFDAASASYQRLTALRPDDAEANFQLATCYEHLGRFDEARELMVRLTAKDGEQLAPARLWLIQRTLKSTDVSAVEDEAKAIASLRLLVLEHPEFNPAREALIEIQLSEGNWDEADKLLAEAATPLRNSTLRLAQARALNGDLARARDEAQALLPALRDRALVVESAEARVAWAQSAALAGNISEAERILREGLALHPTGPFAVELARLYLPLANRMTSADARREQLLRMTLEVLNLQSSASPMARVYAAQAHLALGQLAAAEEALSQVAETDPRGALVLAQLLAGQQRGFPARRAAERALALFEAELRDKPRDIELRLSAAQAATLLRDYGRAVELLEGSPRQVRHSQIARALSNAYVAWWDHREADSQFTRQSFHLTLLQKALSHWPDNVEALRRLSALVDGRGPLASAAGELLAATKSAARFSDDAR